MACDCGCHGMAGGCGGGRGLGDLPGPQYLLSPDQVTDLTTRNLVAQSAVNNLIQTGYWPNGQPGPNGYCVYDDVYGTLLIAENLGNGQLSYNANLLHPEQCGAPVGGTGGGYTSGPINAPTYSSPDYPNLPPGPPATCPGWTKISGITDFLACVSQGFTTLELLALGVAGLWIYSEYRRGAR